MADPVDESGTQDRPDDITSVKAGHDQADRELAEALVRGAQSQQDAQQPGA